jgi:HlyD family secretion protein
MLTELDIDNRNGALYPRMYAHVKLVLVSHPHALRLPISAVNEKEGKASVEVIENGRVVRRSVSVGITEPEYVEIASGLSADELVVNPYNADLKAGESITYTPAAGDAANRLAADP